MKKNKKKTKGFNIISRSEVVGCMSDIHIRRKTHVFTVVHMFEEWSIEKNKEIKF